MQRINKRSRALAYGGGWQAVLLIVLGITQSGCLDVAGPVPPRVAEREVFAELRFTTDAMFIAQGQTLPLKLLATTADEFAIPVEMRNVRWNLNDSVRVQVDSLGNITGNVASNTPIAVSARYTYGLMTRTATINVYVTNEGESSASSLKLIVLDSTRVGPTAISQLLPRLRIDLYNGSSAVRTGVQLPITIPPPLFVSYAPTGGPNGEPVYFVGNGGSFLGNAWIKTSVNLYGTEVMDSVAFTGTYPASLGAAIVLFEDEDGTIVLSTSWQGVEHHLAPCATIVVISQVSRPLDIVFSDSAASSNGCATLPDEMLQHIVFGWGSGFEQRNLIGGNVTTAAGITVGLRRSATRGEVSWYVRDAVTKTRLPIMGRYTNIHVE